MRRNPVPLDATVPSAIALLDLARFGEVSAARCGPVERQPAVSGSRTLVLLSWSACGASRSVGHEPRRRPGRRLGEVERLERRLRVPGRHRREERGRRRRGPLAAAAGGT